MSWEIIKFMGLVRLVEKADFSDKDHLKFAVIEIFSKSLPEFESTINARLTIEKWFRARIEVTSAVEVSERYCKYFAKVIPHDYVPFINWQDATDYLIKNLPKIILDLRP